MSEARLAALWIRPPRRRRGPPPPRWDGVLSQGMERLGCSICRSGPTIDAWPRHPERRWTLDNGGQAVDGWGFSSLWLGPQGRALAVRPRTIYLRPDGGRDNRPEHEIVGENRPRWPLQSRRQALVSILNRLQEACRPHLQGPVRLDAVDPCRKTRSNYLDRPPGFRRTPTLAPCTLREASYRSPTASRYGFAGTPTWRGHPWTITPSEPGAHSNGAAWMV